VVKGPPLTYFPVGFLAPVRACKWRFKWYWCNTRPALNDFTVYLRNM